MKHTWYEAKTGNHQGLIIETETGRNIAVSYDKTDAPLIAKAPEMYLFCKKALNYFCGLVYTQDDIPLFVAELKNILTEIEEKGE